MMQRSLARVLVVLVCVSAGNLLAEDVATHEQVNMISVAREGAASLQTLAATPDGKIVALVGLPRNAAPGTQTKTPLGKVLLLDDSGKELAGWPLDFSGQSIGVGPEGAVYVAGDGQVARFSREGTLLARSEVPHLAAILKDQDKLRQQAEAQLKAQTESIAETVKSFTTQVQALKDKGEDQLTAVEKQQLKSLEVNLKAYEQFAGRKQSIESAITSLTSRLRIINSITATDKEVFIACGELKGYGYAVWRMDLDFKNPQQVLKQLGGCCGQMDVQARGDKLFVAENTRHRVGQYDREGKQIAFFGKRDRESAGECFGGCCNPMNCRVAANGDVYTAESEGVVKRFNAAGEFVSLVGVVKLTGGCKNVAVAASPLGDKVYFCDLPGSRIIVLGQKNATTAASSE